MTAEEIKRKEEERARKKQKEKERIEQLKKEGKYLTKAQKEEKARNELKLQQMLAAGIKVGGPAEGESAKKPKFDKKSKGKKQDKVSSVQRSAGQAQRFRPSFANNPSRSTRRRPSQRLPSVQGNKPRRPPRRGRKRSVSLVRRPRPRLPQRLPRLRRMTSRKTGRPPQHPTTTSRTAGTQTLMTGLMTGPMTGPIRRKHPRGRRRRMRTPRTTNRRLTNQTMAPRPRGRRRPWQGGRSSTRLLLLPGQRMTSDRPFAVFLATSILVRRSCLTRSVRPTSRRVRQVVSLSRLVPLTSPSMPSSRRRTSSTRTASSSSRSLVS